MKPWIYFGAIAWAFTLYIIVHNGVRLTELKEKYEKSQEVNANLALLVSVHIQEQKELNYEYDKSADLVLRHNRTLIHNLKIGRLESEVPKVIPAIVKDPYYITVPDRPNHRLYTTSLRKGSTFSRGDPQDREK